MQPTDKIREKILIFQRLEITEIRIYKRLASTYLVEAGLK